MIERARTLEEEKDKSNTHVVGFGGGKAVGDISLVTDWVRVYKTPYVYNTSKPWWDATEMKMTLLCNNNKTLPLRITAFNYTNSGDNTEYGRCITSVREIEMGKNRIEMISRRGKYAGCIEFDHFEMNMKSSLLKYLHNGWSINTAVAIDFTLSNLPIADAQSLHR